MWVFFFSSVNWYVSQHRQRNKTVDKTPNVQTRWQETLRLYFKLPKGRFATHPQHLLRQQMHLAGGRWCRHSCDGLVQIALPNSRARWARKSNTAAETSPLLNVLYILIAISRKQLDTRFGSRKYGLGFSPGHGGIGNSTRVRLVEVGEAHGKLTCQRPNECF